jgi:phospholipid transport system substrate-binding protein
MKALFPIARRAAIALLVAAGTSLFAQASQAATPAETYVSDNVQRGLAILNNHGISDGQRREQFEHFLLGLTDMRRIALFTLGQYRRSASPAEQDAFAQAFQNYATAVYQSYFSRYAGQTLQVTGSVSNGPGDDVVRTAMIDPNEQNGQQPLEVDFRVNTQGPKPVVLDFSVGGIWLALEERDQFTAFLGQNGGDIKALIAHLGDLAKQFRNGGPPRQG